MKNHAREGLAKGIESEYQLLLQKPTIEVLTLAAKYAEEGLVIEQEFAKREREAKKSS